MSHKPDGPVVQSCLCGLVSLRVGSFCAAAFTFVLTTSQLVRELPVASSFVHRSPNRTGFGVANRSEWNYDKILFLKSSGKSSEFNMSSEQSAARQKYLLAQYNLRLQHFERQSSSSGINTAQKTVQVSWESAGLLAAFICLCTTFKKRQSWLLAWLAWTCINLLIAAVNFCLFLAILTIQTHKQKIQHLPFSFLDIAQFISIPFQIYLVIVVIGFYQTLEVPTVSRNSTASNYSHSTFKRQRNALRTTLHRFCSTVYRPKRSNPSPPSTHNCCPSFNGPCSSASMYSTVNQFDDIKNDEPIIALLGPQDFPLKSTKKQDQQLIEIYPQIGDIQI